MRHRGRTVGLHDARQLASARAAFEAHTSLGPQPWRLTPLGRHAAIAALPTVEWKGRKLRTIRCNGETGKGPHNVNVPESLLWALIDIGSYRCPFHA